jgi:beta-barrel assembly-enhancing protease
MNTNPFARTRAAFVGAAIIGTSAVFGVGVSGCKGGRFGNMISKSQETSLGNDAERDFDNEFRGRIVTSGPQYDRLMRVADKILPLARRDYDVPFRVKLVRDNQVNAFALPGGPMYFYTGLLDLADSDDEVASVLGHEAAHIVRRHSAKQISDQMVKQGLATIALGGSSQTVQTLAGLGLTIDSLRYSRSDESESDKLGFQYLTEAGYNPDAMASFFSKMQQKGGGGGGPSWLSSHPNTGDRVKISRQRAEAYKAGKPIP